MLNKPTDTIASFAKGMRVITCFGRDTPRLSVVEVSQLTGLDRATARRCLLTLYAEGYAEYDGKFFTLTPQILRLGVSALASLPMPQLVQPGSTRYLLGSGNPVLSPFWTSAILSILQGQPKHG